MQLHNQPLSKPLIIELINKDQNNNTHIHKQKIAPLSTTSNGGGGGGETTAAKPLRRPTRLKDDLQEYLYKDNPLISFMDTTYAKSAKIPLRQKLTSLVDMVELTEKKFSALKVDTNKVAVTSNKIIEEIDLCSTSESEDEKRPPANNIEASKETTTSAESVSSLNNDFFEDNLLPNTEGLEAVLNHFNEDTVGENSGGDARLG